MTDNEIIKGLECCGSPYNRCLECPLCETERVKCSTELTANALDLINSQKAENERVQKENEILSANADNAFQEGLNENRELFKEEVEKGIRAEAIKEFVENLKTVAMVVQIGPDPRKKHKIVTVEGIDTVTKKWLGDTNGEI